MKSRLLTIHYFEAYQDIGPYLSDPRVTDPQQSTSQQCSLSVRENWMQFREVRQIGKAVVGRLCKVRVVEKPKIGPAFSPHETDLADQVIESCYFLYHSRNNRLLMQKNDAVSANPTAQMTKLLVHLFPDIGGSGLSISPILRKDMLELLVRSRGVIKRVKIHTTREQRDAIHEAQGGDLEFSDAYLKDTAYKEMYIDYRIEAGGLNAGILKELYDRFKNRQIADVACYLDGDQTPIWLSKYLKFDKIYATVDDSGHLVSHDVFNQLQSIDVD